MKRFHLRNRYWIISIAILFVGILGFWMAFVNKKTVRIGFAAQLTGRQAELGVQIRNGVQLAVEEVNRSGGIAGRKLELLVRDDFGIPEKARSADRELIKSGVVTIIGHATSAQTLAGLTVTNPARVVMMGPTVSTSKLSNIDDYFFRVYPSFKESAAAFAKYIYQSGLTRIAIIYDLDNYAYVKAYSEAFSTGFQALGGNIAAILKFSSATHPDFSPLLLKLQKLHSNGLLIIASDVDTALIAQQTRLISWQIPLFTTAWAQTESLIDNGGSAVEGLTLEQSFLVENQSPKFLDFVSRYSKRFGRKPSFGAAFGYDAASVLAAALVKTGGNTKGLRQSLLKTHDFQGLTDTFSFDRYGDVDRPFYLSSIRNSKFIILKKLTVNKLGIEGK
jgi:branched-chain amino acid transport system substrate-binding protein